MRSRSHKSREPECWTAGAFVDHFKRVNEQMHDRRFAFVLGAGASVSSGIPSGRTLVDEWLRQLHLRDPERKDVKIEEWVKDNLDIDDFQYARRAEFYPQIYDRRFPVDREEGYAYLEYEMKDARPGLGYSMLAQILVNTRHKLVVTTNFDNLVADAVLLYTDTFAQVCGHESLTGFVRATTRRPLVAKIHRDLLSGPQSDQYATNLLHEDWARTLRLLFKSFTPIFVGYGGNDGSLMNFLDALEPGHIPGGVFWCYRLKGEQPGKHIKQLVARQSGVLVPILDFDIFMCELAVAVGFTVLHSEVEQRGTERAAELRKQFESATKLTRTGMASDDPAQRRAFESANRALDEAETRLIKKTGDWWAWERKAQREPDLVKRETIYREALKALPHEGLLVGSFAFFLGLTRKNNDEAEKMFKTAKQLGPESAYTLCNYAAFMIHVRKNYVEAERLCRRAMKLKSADATLIGNYAVLLGLVLGRDDEAVQMYRKTLEAEPENANHNANYAAFLVSRKQFISGADFCDRAWRLSAEKPEQAAAEVGVYRGIVLCMTGKSDEDTLGRLKTLLKNGFERGYWSFNHVLAVAWERLTAADHALYAAVAEAILDPDKVAELDKIPRWREVKPIPLDAPWQPLVAVAEE